MANPRNESTLTSLRQTLEGVDTFFVVEYQGLNAAGITRLRRTLRDKGARMVVAKNTLINIALKDGGRDFSDILHGPSALVIVKDDVAGTAKAISEFAKTNDKGIPNPKGGMLGGTRFDLAMFDKIVNLGSREQLQSELLGVLQAQPSNFVGVLSAKLQEFVGILESYKEQQGGAA